MDHYRRHSKSCAGGDGDSCLEVGSYRSNNGFPWTLSVGSPKQRGNHLLGYTGGVCGSDSWSGEMRSTLGTLWNVLAMVGRLGMLGVSERRGFWPPARTVRKGLETTRTVNL